MKFFNIRKLINMLVKRLMKMFQGGQKTAVEQYEEPTPYQKEHDDDFFRKSAQASTDADDWHDNFIEDLVEEEEEEDVEPFDKMMEDAPAQAVEEEDIPLDVEEEDEVLALLEGEDTPDAPPAEPEPVPAPLGAEPAAPADPDIDVPDDTEDYQVQVVYYGTNRAPSEKIGTIQKYGEEDAQKLTLGAAVITVPRSRTIGSIPRPKKFGLKGVTIWKGKEKANKHFTFYGCGSLTRDTFLKRAGEEAARAETFKGAAFIFLHGFNVSFDDAMYRAAQMAHDMNFDGPAFAYSWPAAGGVLNYKADSLSADLAARHLDKFVDVVLQTPGVDKVHMVAHSMGNFALYNMLDKAGTLIGARDTKTLDQLILAAPDLDVRQFYNVSEKYVQHAKDVTLYACATDRALRISRRVHNGHPRAGDVPEKGPVIATNIDTIDVTEVGTEIFSLNHSGYADNREILTDIARLFSTGTRPPLTRTPTLRARMIERGEYWEMPG